VQKRPCLIGTNVNGSEKPFIMKRLWRWWFIATCVLCFMLSGGRKTAVIAQDETATIEDQARSLFNSMSAAERVGQVFLVPFVGDSAPANSDIADLILNYHVGGVVLLAENNNIIGDDNLQNVPTQLAELNNDLQRLSLFGITTAVEEVILEEEVIEGTPTTLPTPVVTPIPISNPAALPMFIAINHEGDGPIYSEIFNGLTPLPNNMALGATWNPDNAAVVGEIAGRELEAVGVNMIFGPVLDVLTTPSTTSENELGTRSFGGDPYWVGLMGQAYTRGLHEGSNGRLAVIGKHFPGIGSSDRNLIDEIPTVRKTLADLQEVELAPFMAVTGGSTDEAEQVDGLLTSHIRYQGFQGNIQASTAPTSLDRQAISALLTLPEFNPWYVEGGLIVSDALGVRAVERYYDDTEQTFPHRRVAKDAFLAGNDLLVLSDFALGEAPYSQQLENIQNAILWFQELYETDPAFQQRLDEAVLKIIQAKLKQFDEDFSEENVLVNVNATRNSINQGETAVFDIAQQAVTLISPSSEQLLERLPSPPGPQDRIIIFTDMHQATQCPSATCPPQAYIEVEALQNQILALYGPEASGQVQPEQIVSYSLDELSAFLAAGTEPIVLPTPTAVITSTETAEGPDLDIITETNLTPVPTATIPPGYLVQESFKEGVDWIIFAMLEDSDIEAVHNFLAQRQDLFRNSNIIAFSFNAPYFLDSTEISKLTAYYGIYSKVDAFIDAAARTLFLELPLAGRSPVNIQGTNYQVNAQTSPDPSQVIELYIADDEGSTQSPASEAPLQTAVGDTLHLQTGIITDRNGNPVPDNTPVQFIQVDRIQGTVNIIDEVPTVNGIARLDYVLEARTGPGKFRITAVSGEARSSQEVDISIEGEAQVSVITPTSTPSPTPTNTPSPTPTATATPLPPPTETPIPPPPEPQEPAINIALSEFATLIAVLTGLSLVMIAGYLLSIRESIPLFQQIRWVLWGLISALLAYNYVALGLPGTAVFTEWGAWGGLLITLAGGAVGLGLYNATHVHVVNESQ
jgi:beta-N-acetylhexosaminidase